jgi:tryptophan-rich sensory protein
METREKNALYAFLIGTLAVGAVASFFTGPAIAGWYAGLAKPAFNPPDWVFAPVWTALYLMMGFAAWRAWRVAGTRSAAIILYFIQLALNFVWSIFFFGLHQIAFALADAIALAVAILLTMVAFFRTERIAGLLMLPYLGWAAFAAFLNAELWRLN